jgi:prevent-host-death family protein
METINIHEAKTHLSRLVEKAAKGDAFIIAKAGKPVVKVVAIDAVTGKKKRVGFMTNDVSIPDDFNEMGREQIAALFTSATK